jgi:hypothetical protein
MSTFSSTRIPPDPHGAAGPVSLIAVINAQIEGVRKDGTAIFGPDSLDKMLGASRSFLSRPFDPKIVYDVHRKHFVLVALDRFREPEEDWVIESWIYIAVSKTHDPQSATSRDWHIHEINSLVDGTWADFPGLAVDEEAIYITTNQLYYNPPYIFQNPLLWIIPKEPFYSGGGASFNRLDLTGTSFLDYGTYSPAMVRKDKGIAPGVGTYLVMYNGLSSSPKGNEFVQIVQVNSPLNNPKVKVGRVNIGNIEGSPASLFNDAPQKDEQDKGRLVDTGKRRALQAVWVNNQLWMTMTVSDGTQTSAYWVKFNANGIHFPPTLTDKGRINGEDIALRTFTAFPALDVNSKGVAAFGFSAFARRFFPSAFVMIRDDNVDPPGTVRRADVVRAGEGPYFLYSLDANADATDEEKKKNRWGDYSSISWDPDDQDCFWAFNEYAAKESWSPTGEQSGEQFGSWKTVWARLCYTPPPCKLVNQGCVRTAQCCPPKNKVCEGPVGGNKTCKVCRGKNLRCARSSQCCGRLLCKNKQCRP